jgi:hypothetical protein
MHITDASRQAPMNFETLKGNATLDLIHHDVKKQFCSLLAGRQQDFACLFGNSCANLYVLPSTSNNRDFDMFLVHWTITIKLQKMMIRNTKDKVGIKLKLFSIGSIKSRVINSLSNSHIKDKIIRLAIAQRKKNVEELREK